MTQRFTEYWDVYTLAGERSVSMIQRFVAVFLSNNTLDKRSFEYVLTSGAQSLYVGADFDSFIRLGSAKPHAEGSARIYLANDDAGGGWIYFNGDGSLVLGLTVPNDHAQKTLQRLSTEVGNGYGYIVSDAPPCDTANAFMAACRQGSREFTALAANVKREQP